MVLQGASLNWAETRSGLTNIEGGVPWNMLRISLGHAGNVR